MMMRCVTSSFQNECKLILFTDFRFLKKVIWSYIHCIPVGLTLNICTIYSNLSSFVSVLSTKIQFILAQNAQQRLKSALCLSRNTCRLEVHIVNKSIWCSWGTSAKHSVVVVYWPKGFCIAIRRSGPVCAFTSLGLTALQRWFTEN